MKQILKKIFLSIYPHTKSHFLAAVSTRYYSPNFFWKKNFYESKIYFQNRSVQAENCLFLEDESINNGPETIC